MRRGPSSSLVNRPLLDLSSLTRIKGRQKREGRELLIVRYPSFVKRDEEVWGSRDPVRGDPPPATTRSITLGGYFRQSKTPRYNTLAERTSIFGVRGHSPILPLWHQRTDSIKNKIKSVTNHWGRPFFHNKQTEKYKGT